MSADGDAQEKESERLQIILQGAFAGSPTPLADIPKKETRVRPESEPQERRARRQRKKRAA